MNTTRALTIRLLLLLSTAATIVVSQGERIGPFMLMRDQYLMEANYGRGTSVTFKDFDLPFVYGTKDGNTVSVTYERFGDPRTSYINGVLLMRQNDLPRPKGRFTALPPMTTQKGIGIGDTMKKVPAAYGDSASHELLKSQDLVGMRLPESFRGAEMWTYGISGEDDGVGQYLLFYFRNGVVIGIALTMDGC